MANKTNSLYDVLAAAKDTYPFSSNGTGTIDVGADTNVVGSGTLFGTEVKQGDYLFNAADDELRQVVKINSATSLSIDAPFTTPIVATAPVYTPQSNLVEISVFIAPADAAGEINGNVLPPGVGISWGKTGRTTSANRDLIDPIVLDATGTTIYIQALI